MFIKFLKNHEMERNTGQQSESSPMHAMDIKAILKIQPLSNVNFV